MDNTASDVIDDEADQTRRKFLYRATTALGALGIAFAAIPFVESWLPSERARSLGGAVKLDVTKIEPGQMAVVTWRRKPIYVVRRTPSMLAELGTHDTDLKDPTSGESEQPAYARNALRSRTQGLFVTIGICTHLGCLPKARFKSDDAALGSAWPGGWLCPCHGSRFDLAGRVFRGSPASVNLVIPPYAFASAAELIIGVDAAAKAET